MGFVPKPVPTATFEAHEMAIYSLHHQPIGKTTQARPHTSAAHVRYITRPTAASRIEAGRMPEDPRKAQTFMVDAENGDRKNARVADKILLALPRELDAEQRAELVRGYANEVTQGRAPWLAAFHDQGKDHHNPHAHLIVRDRDPETGKRVAGLSEKGSTERLRSLWESHANRALEKAGRRERIDRRTLEAQGIEREPTVHEGPRAQQMDRRGARPTSRLRQLRNQPGSRLPHRQVDYRGIDQGRTRPGYNRDVRETPADYWQAIDADKQTRELDQLRAIHHRPDSVIAFPARRPVPHGVGSQHAINPGVVGRDLAGLHLPPGSQPSLFAPVPPAGKPEIGTPKGVARPTRSEKIFEPSQRAAEQPTKPIEQNVSHKPIVGNKIPERKGDDMSVDEEKRRQQADLAQARTNEEKSRAARNNALEAGYMRPDLAGPSIDKFYKNKGADKLQDRFNQFAGPSEFGVKKGNPLTKDGRAKRADANEARRDLPQLWDKHAQDRKNRDASERAFGDKYGPPDGQGGSSGSPDPYAWKGPRSGQQGQQPQQATGQPWQGAKRDTPAQQAMGQPPLQPTNFMSKPHELRQKRQQPERQSLQGQRDPSRIPRGGRGDDE